MKPTLGASVLALLIAFSGAACSKEQEKPWFPVTRSHSAGAASGLAGDAPHDAPLPMEREGAFGARGAGVAWVDDTSGRARVVLDGRAGRPWEAVGDLVLSGDGRRLAYRAFDEGKWRIVVGSAEGAPFDEVLPPVLSPDGTRVAYVAREGSSWHLVVDARPGEGKVRPFGPALFDATSTRLAFIEEADAAGWGRLVVVELATGRRTVIDERATSLLLDERHTRAAAVVATPRGMRVLSFDVAKPEQVERGPEQETVRQLAFGAEGTALAYVAERGGKRFVVLDSREQVIADGDDPVTPPVVRPDRRGVGLFVLSRGSVVLRQYFAPGPAVEEGYEAAEGLVYSADGRSAAYAARKAGKWFVVVDGAPGMAFDRVVTPVFAPRDARLVYRARQGMRRFVVVAGRDGKVAAIHPAYDQVYPVVFSADGKSLSYGVKDGAAYRWRVERL